MDLHIACPGCDKHFRVAAEHSGQKVKCPSCQTLFLVPSSEEPDSPSAPAPGDDVNSGAPSGYSQFEHLGQSTSPAGSQHPGSTYPASSQAGQHGHSTESGGSYPQGGSTHPGYAVATTGHPPYTTEKPSNIQAIGVMMLVGGIMGIMAFLGIGLGSSCICFFWPPLYLQIITGIMCIVKGSQLLGNEAQHGSPPTIFAVMMILNVLNLDFLNMTLGIICLVMLNDSQTRSYFRG